MKRKPEVINTALGIAVLAMLISFCALKIARFQTDKSGPVAVQGVLEMLPAQGYPTYILRILMKPDWQGWRSGYHKQNRPQISGTVLFFCFGCLHCRCALSLSYRSHPALLFRQHLPARLLLGQLFGCGRDHLGKLLAFKKHAEFLPFKVSRSSSASATKSRTSLCSCKSDLLERNTRL